MDLTEKNPIGLTIEGIKVGGITAGPVGGLVGGLIGLGIGVTIGHLIFDQAEENSGENITPESTEGQACNDDQKGKIQPSESPVWQGFKPWRGKTKTNGRSGRGREYYEWDYTHGDIEVYDNNGKHKGSQDPTTGEWTKKPKTGRKIDI